MVLNHLPYWVVALLKYWTGSQRDQCLFLWFPSFFSPSPLSPWQLSPPTKEFGWCSLPLCQRKFWCCVIKAKFSLNPWGSHKDRKKMGETPGTESVALSLWWNKPFSWLLCHFSSLVFLPLSPSLHVKSLLFLQNKALKLPSPWSLSKFSPNESHAYFLQTLIISPRPSFWYLSFISFY